MSSQRKSIGIDCTVPLLCLNPKDKYDNWVRVRRLDGEPIPTVKEPWGIAANVAQHAIGSCHKKRVEF